MSKIQEHNVFNYPTFANESLGAIYVKDKNYLGRMYRLFTKERNVRCSVYSAPQKVKFE